MRAVVTLLLTLCALHLLLSALAADEIEKQIEIIRTTGPQGAGSEQAKPARDRLARRGPEILPRLLVAMDTKNIVAANWLRTVYEEIVARELAADNPKFPLQFLRRYVRDSHRQGRVRRLVLNLLDRLDPDFRPKLIPRLLDDPEFRDEAIATALKLGDDAKKSGEIETARLAYYKAFRHARSSRRVLEAAARLESLGEQVSVVEHLGFVTDWYLLGPFDAPGESGYHLTFPPENRVDLQAEYVGKTGGNIRWKRFQTEHQLGQVDLIQAIAPVKEAVGYAYTELNSPSEQSVELRCGADDNLTVWLNGKKVFTRLQWLNGTRLDRFAAPATLRAGRNRLLVKICQGPQHKNPEVPNNWSLQLRFCKKDGAGVGFTSALPPIDEAE